MGKEITIKCDVCGWEEKTRARSQGLLGPKSVIRPYFGHHECKEGTMGTFYEVKIYEGLK